jgi:hypothetical protein
MVGFVYIFVSVGLVNGRNEGLGHINLHLVEGKSIENHQFHTREFTFVEYGCV